MELIDRDVQTICQGKRCQPCVCVREAHSVQTGLVADIRFHKTRKRYSVVQCEDVLLTRRGGLLEVVQGENGRLRRVKI
jgi:hypothetical protein